MAEPWDYIESCIGADAIVLDTPLVPGDTFTFSADMGTETADRWMEVWGSDSLCTEGELLWEGPMGPGIICIEVSPQAGTYESLKWKWTTNAPTYMDPVICPAGSCGE